MISSTQIANANDVKLPQSKAVTAAVDKDVAKLRGIAKRHAKQHETVVAISLPWEKLAGIIQHWGQASKYTEVGWVRASHPCAYTLTCLLGPGGVQ